MAEPITKQVAAKLKMWNSPLASRACGWQALTNNMQKPNYQFEKRRKEMDKKAKKEAKRLQKLEAARSPGAVEGATPASPAEQT